MGSGARAHRSSTTSTGAYVMGNTSTTVTAIPVATGSLEKTETVHRFFSLEYQNCSSAPFPVVSHFPASLVNAVTRYNYLISDVG